MGELIAAHRPDLIVIACNTASTIALPALRKNIRCRSSAPCRRSSRLAPARSPAASRCSVPRQRSRANIRVRLSATMPAIVRSRWSARRTSPLTRRRSLRALRPKTPRSRPRSRPCFREDGARTDTVVLACTHYPLILERLRRLAPWPVNFIDPAPAIARRVVSLWARRPPRRTPARPARFSRLGALHRPALARFGIHSGEPAATGTA